jgi:hypothetical protein
MSYEFLVLHALKNKLVRHQNNKWDAPLITKDSGTPEEITEWLWLNFYSFVDGNHTRVALNRLLSKGYVVRNEDGTYCITPKGEQYYEENKDKIFHSPLTPTELCIYDLLCEKAIEFNKVYRFKVKEVAEVLGMPFKRCLSTCLSLHCKNKAFLLKIKDEYWVRLSFLEFEKLKEVEQIWRLNRDSHTIR